MRTIQTKAGPVPVWGAFDDPDRPLLLVIRGALPALDHMEDLVSAIAGADVALVHLPGMHTPFFRESAPAAFAAAFDEVLEQLGHRDVAVMGVSIGGVVALSMRSPRIRGLLLLDTPLTNGELGPLAAHFRQVSANHTQARAWFASLFGIQPDGLEPRDYRGLLGRLAVPATVMVGGVRLGQGQDPTRADASLVSQADRDAYAAHPLATLRIVEGAGHNLGRGRVVSLVADVQSLVDEAAGA